MFSSSGFFADIDCPFSKRGLCERPHCLYRHATETPDVLGACCISSLTDSAGQCSIHSSELSVEILGCLPVSPPEFCITAS